MINNLTSNQARWDLIIQQEARSAMAESVVSTSSSSGGGGSFQCESRRDSLEPPPPNYRFVHGPSFKFAGFFSTKLQLPMHNTEMEREFSKHLGNMQF